VLPTLLCYLPQPEELSEQARKMRDMLVTSIRDTILQLDEEGEMGDWDAELRLMKEALDKASDKFLAAYRSSLMRERLVRSAQLTPRGHGSAELRTCPAK